MPRWTLLVCLLAVACADTGSDALVQVEVVGSPAGARQLRVVVTLDSGGRMSQPVLFPPAPLPGPLSLPMRFSLRTPVGLRGGALVTVDGLDGAGGRVNGGDQHIEIVPGREIPVRVCLSGDCPEPDAGLAGDGAAGPDASGGPDAGGPDAAPVSCSGDGQCPAAACDACTWATTCAQSGTRTCHSFHCVMGKCQDTPATDSAGCARTTTDVECQQAACTYGGCSYASVCAASGQRRADCTQYRCAGGQCVGQSSSTMVGMGCDRTTEGQGCTLQAWCLQISNTVECECHQGMCANPCGWSECRNL